MTPYRSKGAKTFKCRVYDKHGTMFVRSLKTKDAREAREIAAMLRRFRERRKWRVIDLVISKALSPVEIHDAHEGGYLARLLRETKAKQKTASTRRKNPLLSDLVAEWERSHPSAEYLRQVKLFAASIDKGHGTLERFRRKDISTFLGTLTWQRGSKTLPASGSTKNRYRVALSQFGRFLVEREYIPTNPVRDVRGATENKPRMTYHTRDQAKAIVAKLEGTQRALEALMAGTGVEWQVIERVRRRDVIPETKGVWAQGTKTERYHAYRTRWVYFTEDWAWAEFWKYASTKAPDELLFTEPEWSALVQHKAALKALNLDASTLHDWRHTYAIYTLSDGVAPQAVKRQLGHAPNSTMLERVYSAWIPTRPEDYAKRKSEATPPEQPDTALRPILLPVDAPKGGPRQWS